MSKIDEILKNEKVEWKKIDEIGEIFGGLTGKKKEDFQNGNYRYISYKNVFSNLIIDLELNDFVKIKEGENQRELKYGDIIFTASSETKYECGIVSVIPDRISEKIYLNSFCFFLRLNGKKLILPEYLGYLFRTEAIRKEVIKTSSGVTRYNISKNLFRNILIPIPSIETQEKIVEILDNFTNYVTELQTELQNRSKQYNYYRDKLLSEDYLNKLQTKTRSYKYEVCTLGDVGEFIRGNGLQKKDFTLEGNPIIHYGQIYTKYSFETNKTISFTSDCVFNKLKKAKEHDLLIATTSENFNDVGKCLVWNGKCEIGFSGDMYAYRTTQNTKFIAYFFQTDFFRKQKESKVTGTKLIRLHGDDLSKFKIILPEKELQDRIVNILDKFRECIDSTEGLIPEEILKRQKQYEYYREKLLTFDCISDKSVSQSVSQSVLLISNEYISLLLESEYIVGIINKNNIHSFTISELTQKVSNIDWKGTKSLYKYIDLTSVDRSNGSILGLEMINASTAPSRARQIVNSGDIIFGTTRPMLQRIAIIPESLNSQIASTGFSVLRNNNLILNKWLYYSLQTEKFMNYVETVQKGASYPSISENDLRQYKIFVPTIEMQQYIINILEKFEEISNSLVEGLPKEIELRQKQYEYYREKLLSFEKES